MSLIIQNQLWQEGNSNINPKKLGDGTGVFVQNLDMRNADFRGLKEADGVHTLTNGPAFDAVSMRYFAIDEGVAPADPIPAGTPVTARTAFLSALSAYSVETCESLTHNANDPTLTFGSITCTTTGFKAIEDATDSRPNGRANTTASGTKFIETRNDETLAPAPIPSSKLTFSSPIAAFGAYITDVADFYSQVRIWLNLTDGTRRVVNIPIPDISGVGEGSVAFLGFISDVTINSIEFLRDDCFAYYDTTFLTYVNLNTDQIGLDDIVVATAAQVNLTEVGYPNPWINTWGFESLWKFDFETMVSGETNQFLNFGALTNPIYVGPDGSGSAVDSVANSTTGGTWVTETGFTGKCYRCNGERLTINYPDILQTSLNYMLYAGGLTIDFQFKRSASRVGTGEIVHIPNLLSIRCDASHNIELSLTITEAGPTTTTYTLTSSSALSSGTKYHVRVMVMAGDQGSNVYALRGAIFIDGTMTADSEVNWSSAATRLGTGTIGDMLLGGKDGSNYTPGYVDTFNVSNTLRNQFANFTAPTGTIGEIYPPGMFINSSGVISTGTGGSLAQQNWIYRMGRETQSDTEFWLSSALDGDAARSLLASDPTERTYITGAGFSIPSFTDNTFLTSPPYPDGGYDLGIPAPTTGMALSIATAGTGVTETRSYLHTFLRYNDDEGPPSDAVLIDCPQGSTITISSLPAIPGGNNSNITKRRIYVSTGGDYELCAEVTIATTSTTDTGTRGSILQTGGSTSKPAWLPPPDDAIGIIELWAGMHGLFEDKQYLTCVPFNPHAWPAEFRRQVPDRIVGTAKYGQYWLLATTGTPRVVIGTTPAGMVDGPINLNQSCVSKRSVVGVGHGVCWAGPKGLCYHGQKGSFIMTEDVLTPSEWDALEPSSIIGAHWGDWYIGFYDNGTKAGFMINTVKPQGIIYLTQGAYAVFNDPINDALYLLDTGNVILKWDTGAVVDATFKSRVFRHPRATNAGAARIIGTTYPYAFSLWCDGVLRVNARTISNDNGFRLPGGYTAEEFQFQIVGKGPGEALLIGEEMVDI